MRCGLPTGALISVAMAAMVAVGCGSDGGGGACPSAAPTLRVDEIRAAIAAVEAQLGGPQEYFEVNATSGLVNLFVADSAAGSATPFVYVGGQVSSNDPLLGASGATFRADALAFDATRLTSCVAAELPESSLDALEIVGGPGGTAQYSVISTSPAGGQMIIAVGADGAILATDPVQDAETPSDDPPDTSRPSLG